MKRIKSQGAYFNGCILQNRKIRTFELSDEHMAGFFSIPTPLIVSVLLALLAMLIGIVVQYTGVVLRKPRAIGTFVVAVVTGSLSGLIGLISIEDHKTSFFLLLQAAYLLAGIWGSVLLKKSFFSEPVKALWVDFLLAFVFVLISFAAFSFTFNHLSSGDLGFVYGTAMLTFFIPHFYIYVQELFISIPPPLYKVWYIDEDREEPDFENVNIKNIMLATLDILKNVNDADSTNIKVKAPLNMKFGDWFQSFVLSYNERYPESEIQYKYLDGTNMGWMFFVKPRFFERRQYIEPNKTFRKNGITEKHTIVAERARFLN